MIIKISNLRKYYSVLDEDIFIESQKALLEGEKFIDIPQYKFDDIERRLAEYKLYEKQLQQCAKLNNIGKIQEKEGKIKSAIRTYEKNIALAYPATHSFDRLMKLYRKLKDFDNELRVIQIAIDVFTKENERRAEYALSKYPELYYEITSALEDNQNVKSMDGRYVFVQYDIMKYITRMDKVKSLISKSNPI